jgi:hypothetical protein
MEEEEHKSELNSIFLQKLRPIRPIFALGALG